MCKYKVVSLFCGCGGLDLGFVGGFTFLGKKYDKNNLDIVYANDINKCACETYNYNFERKCCCEDVCDITTADLPNCDIVIGGFPCQDFSLAGNRKGFSAERGRLYKQMLRIVKEKKPMIFIAENVEGITLELDGIIPIKIIEDDFSKLGYKVQYKLMNTADYGVPQIRKRVIIVGVRGDIPSIYFYPTKKQEGWVTVRMAIDDLRSLLGTDKIANHTMKDFSKAKFNVNGKGQGNRRLKADEPSITIRAEHHGNIEGHYRTLNDEDSNNPLNWRRLSVRECARIQSFPDNFIFPCKASAAYRQIGNAVPPVFAWYIARSITEFLDKICDLTK